ncbi:M23 family metallopeptidase [Solitalea sp. MAHUQ-68]|uniref:M23 family metallopeptidase n=1 Tax=Solitalea agri TaxID=2953739 RepID=A0A9X2JEJ4_9SPHI|nr:M23 family metallopeptidase [Solitalea agri]MCO4294010.1 M23 family metallopeptidase [Solitalea agri]
MSVIKGAIALSVGLATYFGYFISNNDNPKQLPAATTTAQERTYPQDYFRLPMDIPVAIAGTFGELRPNHFHTGLDFKTQQRTGFPIYAVADGYISRIRVQVWGFGNAAYIDHPNGFTSVYAHMMKYSPRLEAVLRNAQASRQSFEVDFNLLPTDILVKKGELIGYSGDTGSSGGPHLHFEIRDTKTEEPINPLLFGLPVKDTKKPFIKGFYVYPMNDSSSVNGSNVRAGFPIANKGNGEYSVSQAATINLNGQIGFGIITDDMQDGAGNLNGIYSIELKRDDQTVFKTVFDHLDFSLQRCINAYIDYHSFQLNKNFIQKSFVDPGNKLPVYKIAPASGIQSFEINGDYKFEYIVKDVAGNVSSLAFNVKGTNIKKFFQRPAKVGTTQFYWDKENQYTAENLIATFPVGCFFDDFNFDFKMGGRIYGAYSNLFTIHNKSVPINQPYTLLIKPDASLTVPEKAVIVSENKTYQGGEFENGYVKAQLKSFGTFYLAVDTLAPRITPLNIVNEKNMSASSTITFRVGDALSGVKEWKGMIDGEWVLFEMNGKTGVLKHTFSSNITTGIHTLQLVVTDMKNNSSLYEADFYR